MSDLDIDDIEPRPRREPDYGDDPVQMWTGHPHRCPFCGGALSTRIVGGLKHTNCCGQKLETCCDGAS